MPTKRMDTLLELLQQKPKDAFLLFALAQEYQKADDIEQAISYYKKVIASDPNYVGLYYHLAHCYAEIDDVPKAMNTYKCGIEVAKNLNDTHALGELLNAKTNLEMEML